MPLSKHTYNIVFKLDARIPLIRGNLKLTASTHVTKAYDLGPAGKGSVIDLLKDMKLLRL